MHHLQCTTVVALLLASDRIFSDVSICIISLIVYGVVRVNNAARTNMIIIQRPGAHVHVRYIITKPPCYIILCIINVPTPRIELTTRSRVHSSRHSLVHFSLSLSLARALLIYTYFHESTTALRSHCAVRLAVNNSL